jgi:hypothetical protein
MKLKNTLLSIVRMALVSGGTYLVNSGKLSAGDAQALTGLGLAILGAIWDAKDEHSAENPGLTLPTLPPGAVRLLVGMCILGSALTFTGCASAPGGAPIDVVRVEKNATRIVKVAAIYALQTEPGAGAELQRISAGVDTVFGRGSLTPEQLNAFLDELKVRPENRLLMAAAITEVYEIITDLTGAKLPDITHPVVVAALNGVKAGIAEALALQAAVQPAAK